MRRLSGALLTIFAVLATLTAPAAAQDGQTDEERLLARELALTNQISEFEQTLLDFDSERSRVLTDIDNATAAIEGSTDALEQLALARREPTRTQVAIALERFVSGDPAQEALVQGLATADSDTTPFQNQEVYGSILEVTRAEIERIDEQSQRLQAQIPELLSERTLLAERLTTIDATVRTLRIDLSDAQEELGEVTEDLAWYRNAASRSVLTGRDNPAGNARAALVVKIDNVGRARPQAGINDADLVYVELVEGGQTRYAAVFHSEDPASIGPARSMRTTDVNLLRGLNRPLFASSGANQVTTSAVNASPLVNISAATGAGGAYFRSSGRPAPHNLFTSAGALRSAGGSAGGAPPEQFNIRRPGTELPNQSEATGGVNVSYGRSSVSYTWNGSGWARSQDGAATVDIDGERTAPETVIVQFTPYGVSPADAASPEAQVVGTGTAWIFTEGVLVRGSWSKADPDSVFEYTDQNGDPLEILPGRVWVELPRSGGASLR